MRPIYTALLLLISVHGFSLEVKKKPVPVVELESFKVETCQAKTKGTTGNENKWLQVSQKPGGRDGSIRFKASNGTEIKLTANEVEGEGWQAYEFLKIECEHKLIYIRAKGWESGGDQVFSLVDGKRIIDNFLFSSEDRRFFIGVEAPWSAPHLNRT